MVDMEDQAELPIDYIQTIPPHSSIADVDRLAGDCRLGMCKLVVIVDFWVFEMDWNSHCSKRDQQT